MLPPRIVSTLKQISMTVAIRRTTMMAKMLSLEREKRTNKREREAKDKIESNSKWVKLRV